ncbi:hypothetical protein IV38_GL001218 [Lactobacillus selangorensis]|uniref:Uncharacterized protein n=1 Tax=Lactobacillus selangorensis TaxID=81857 RepID=A0A0R2G5U4_9LACO|nr:hypothetical protein [Lactobacillus selangorensis]KRN29004.1 hypothetical protein IV38_GL001218 [Lactobacillus selangorensis]KRN32586.1 hypothetical protein IV40_GL000635 [Lactobacillus selangorensis]
MKLFFAIIVMAIPTIYDFLQFRELLKMQRKNSAQMMDTQSETGQQIQKTWRRARWFSLGGWVLLLVTAFSSNSYGFVVGYLLYMICDIIANKMKLDTMAKVGWTD